MKTTQISKWLLVTGILIAILGCSSHQGKNAEERAISTAKQEVKKRGWKRIEVDDCRFEEGRWKVYVWRFPKTPRGHATVEVSDNGQVLRYIAGE
ncbi:MAG: hypothetical protein K0Q55_1929 [Verrucomicrobia bacterium]|jgi:hypothetical protein|nr:hypothetical protein [Verrucomicrobiota bacterium]